MRFLMVFSLFAIACASAPEPRPTLPDTIHRPLTVQPTKADVIVGMLQAKTPVVRCYDQYRSPGLAKIAIVVAPTGEVLEAAVHESLTPAEFRDCIVAAVRKVTFRPFTGPPFSFIYPMMLR
jgi:hypothetical protein